MITRVFAPLADFVQKRLTLEPHVISGLPETLPLSFEGRAPSVLCIHGFTGVPAEVRLGCEVAQKLGLAAQAPCLAGHGGSSQDLASTTFEDWVASVRPTFDHLRSRGKVILLGLSLGSLIATRLAIESPGDVLGVALLANAFWLHSPYPALALDLADRLGLPDFGVRKNGSDLGDDRARATHVSYQVQPVRAAISLLRAGEAMREQVHLLHRPTLLLHGAQDRVCPVENAWKVAERLTISDIRVVVFPRSRHILTRDVERHQVFQELEAFFTRLVLEEGGGRSPAIREGSAEAPATALAECGKAAGAAQVSS